MKKIGVVLEKEWKCFAGSDWGMFVVYLVLIMIWSLLIATTNISDTNNSSLWLVFFSVVLTANFSNSTFISERVNGSLEILITSGLSRNAILYGKILFVMIMTMSMGTFCLIVAWFLFTYPFGFNGSPIGISDYFLFTGSAFLSISSSAYLSVKMNNPRLLHILNLLQLGVLMGIYYTATYFVSLRIYYLIMAMVVAGILFCIGAQKIYKTEKILQPVYL